MKDSYGIDPIERTCREFAVWVARRAGAISGCKRLPCESVVLAVEGYLRGEISFQEMRAEHQKAGLGISGAGVCGFPNAIPSAAVQIASYHTGDESAVEAVHNTVHHAAYAAGFTALGKAAHDLLDSSEAASPRRNWYVWRKKPHISLAARLIEKAILEGEFHCRLAATCETHYGSKLI